MVARANWSTITEKFCPPYLIERAENVWKDGPCLLFSSRSYTDASK